MRFMEYFDEDIEVLWGHYMDDSLEDEIKVSVVATGFDQTVSVAGKGSDVSDEQRQLQLLREQYQTLAPCFNNSSTTALPIPQLPPVTTAVIPLKSYIFYLLVWIYNDFIAVLFPHCFDSFVNIFKCKSV